MHPNHGSIDSFSCPSVVSLRNFHHSTSTSCQSQRPGVALACTSSYVTSSAPVNPNMFALLQPAGLQRRLSTLVRSCAGFTTNSQYSCSTLNILSVLHVTYLVVNSPALRHAQAATTYTPSPSPQASPPSRRHPEDIKTTNINTTRGRRGSTVSRAAKGTGRGKGWQHESCNLNTSTQQR